MHLVLQHCCKTSWVAMLRVLPPTSNLSYSKSGCSQAWLTRVVKRATSPFNWFCGYVEKQFERLCCPFYRSLRRTGLGLALCSSWRGSTRRSKERQGLTLRVRQARDQRLDSSMNSWWIACADRWDKPNVWQNKQIFFNQFSEWNFRWIFSCAQQESHALQCTTSKPSRKKKY